MLAVAAEQLVGAHAGQEDLDPDLPRRLADEIRVDRGGVADRLIEHRHDARQHVRHVRRDFDLVQLDPVGVGDLARIEEVVGHRLELAVFLAKEIV